MVQRYIEIPEAEVATCMHEHSAGDWVMYEDYECLKQEFMGYVVIKEKQMANLERALGAGETKYD